jgi:anti-anti-sigma regulatory factor
MPSLLWLDIIALSISVVIASSMTLLVLGVGLRHTLNRLFALFTLLEAVWAVFNLLLRLSLGLERGYPVFFTEMVALTMVLMGPLLLMFTTRYVGRHTRQSDVVAALGFVTIAILCVPLFKHQLVFNPHLEANGTTIVEFKTLGFVATSLPLLYMLWSLLLFWQERRRTTEPYLASSVLILVIGFVVGGVLNIPFPVISITQTLSFSILAYGVIRRQLFNPLRELTEELEHKVQERTQELQRAYTEVEKLVEERTAELQHEIAERERLQQEVIDSQRQAIQELSTPIIPIMDRILVMPLVGSIDSMRAQDIMRALLAGIRAHRAQVVILDITGVPIVDSGVANHLNKAIQAAQLKGAQTIITGITDAVAEAIVDLGIDWSGIETLSDLQTGLAVALDSLGFKLSRA